MKCAVVGKGNALVVVCMFFFIYIFLVLPSLSPHFMSCAYLNFTVNSDWSILKWCLRTKEQHQQQQEKLFETLQKKKTLTQIVFPNFMCFCGWLQKNCIQTGWKDEYNWFVDAFFFLLVVGGGVRLMIFKMRDSVGTHKGNRN